MAALFHDELKALQQVEPDIGLLYFFFTTDDTLSLVKPGTPDRAIKVNIPPDIMLKVNTAMTYFLRDIKDNDAVQWDPEVQEEEMTYWHKIEKRYTQPKFQYRGVTPQKPLPQTRAEERVNYRFPPVKRNWLIHERAPLYTPPQHPNPNRTSIRKPS